MSAAARPAPAAALATIAVVAGAVLFGTTAYFGRALQEMGLAPPAIAFYRFALTAAALAPFVRIGGARRAAAAAAFGGGMAMGLGWCGWVEALDHLPVAQTGVLFMTYPLFTIALAALLFAERPTGRAIIAAALVVAAALVATPLSGEGAAPLPVVLALAAPAAYGLLLNILARAVRGMPPLGTVATVAAGAVAGVSPLALALPADSLLPSDRDTLLMLAVFSLATALAPQLLFVRYVPVVGAVRTAMAGSVELPTMFAVGWVAFGEAVGPAHALAAMLVVAAIAIGAVPPGGAAARGRNEIP
jgi:drug/metabolite transporter (DMT)-like permease